MDRLWSFAAAGRDELGRKAPSSILEVFVACRRDRFTLDGGLFRRRPLSRPLGAGTDTSRGGWDDRAGPAAQEPAVEIVGLARLCTDGAGIGPGVAATERRHAPAMGA